MPIQLFGRSLGASSRLRRLTQPPTRSAEISIASRLDATAAQVWDRVTTPAGITDEMRPYLRMTVPARVEKLDPESIELGERIGRSWILLFGLIPFDYDDLTLVRLDPGRGFLERSRMLSQRSWEHERTLEPSDDGTCLLTDRVRWQPRLGLPGAPLRPMIAWSSATGTSGCDATSAAGRRRLKLAAALNESETSVGAGEKAWERPAASRLIRRTRSVPPRGPGPAARRHLRGSGAERPAPSSGRSRRR